MSSAEESQALRIDETEAGTWSNDVVMSGPHAGNHGCCNIEHILSHVVAHPLSLDHLLLSIS